VPAGLLPCSLPAPDRCCALFGCAALAILQPCELELRVVHECTSSECEKEWTITAEAARVNSGAGRSCRAGAVFSPWFFPLISPPIAVPDHPNYASGRPFFASRHATVIHFPDSHISGAVNGTILPVLHCPSDVFFTVHRPSVRDSYSRRAIRRRYVFKGVAP
jgi:hypothetical protein